MNNLFLEHSGAKYPIICGPMYPCSNPELVAAVSAAGGLGIIQPISLSYVHGYEFNQGIDLIQKLTSSPVGMNLLIEKSSKKYHQKMEYWLACALDKGVRFFITSLGKPDWVVKKAESYNAYIYHDVTEKKWAEKAIDSGVDGLIAVNNRAGGHAGAYALQQLINDLSEYNKPVVCAGGIADSKEYHKALSMGYQAVQMGTRFIVSNECNASLAYKQAIIDAHESDIALSERITGVPVSVINTDYIKKRGLKPNYIERWMLAHPKLKYTIRTFFALKSMYSLKHSLFGIKNNHEYWQAGKSAGVIHEIEPVEDIIESLLNKV